MPSPSTSKLSHTDSAHEPFSPLCGAAKNYPLGNFVALTHDISFGVKTCLEIINAANLQRTLNVDADPDEEVLPALNTFDCDALMTLSIASMKLLQESAERSVDWINKYGPDRMADRSRRAS
ncbi:hypothetical protein [Collimonas humicola]|uniref:hypothetical protein n=1 Tax=Collimonas humicola TaxID=2825886 RepID=UPI001B8B1AAC|nr:hypothetical protein [Collimonas humicola]